MVTQNEPGNTEHQDLITVNRQHFVNLWKEWERSECRFFEAIAGLVGELTNRIDRDHSGRAKFAMLDLMFSEAEQHKMFSEWEAEEKQAEDPFSKSDNLE